MRKAVFFSGHGTVYSYERNDTGGMQIYPETMHALRFFQRRGFVLVLLTSDGCEYRNFKSLLKDKTLNLYQLKGGEDNIRKFISEHNIDISKSYYISDGIYINIFHRLGIKVLLVLTGKGFFTYNAMNSTEMGVILDVCKDIYAAAFRVVFHDGALK